MMTKNKTKLNAGSGLKRVFLACTIWAVACASSVHGSVTILIFESGNDLVFSTTGGTLDLRDLNSFDSYAGWGAGMDPSPSIGVWAGGTAGSTNGGNHWNGSVSVDATNWNLTASFANADFVSVMGDYFGFGSDYLSVPGSFTQSVNAVAASSVVFYNKSLADIGLSQGESLTASWGSTNADVISVSAVPEPQSVGIWIGLAALVGCALPRRRRS